MAFGSVLKRLREEKNLSQRDISEYLGITRQAVAAYEIGKREPDYETLRSLADYFGVSVDYLIGRETCRELNAFTVAKNIEMIKGSFSYKEFSEDIARKTSEFIFPEMLELYARGERMPFIGTIKILAKYAGVHETFFYNYNTLESYSREKEIYKNGITEEPPQMSDSVSLPGVIPHLGDNSLNSWLSQEENIKYVALAKELQESGLTVDFIRAFTNSLRYKK